MTTKQRAVVVGLDLPEVPEEEFISSLAELRRLADTLGLEVIAEVTQKRDAPDKVAVVGSGKLRELARFTGGSGVVPSGAPKKKTKQLYVGSEDEDAEDEDEPVSDSLPEEERAKIVLVDREITPSQARNLERALDAQVMDRTGLILAIFQRHARTREARIEVEIARLNYETPRLREVGASTERQRGGIGGKGSGESALELDRRRVRDRIAELRRELATIGETERVQRSRRQEFKTVALVGYTNAGKSSLMRTLTGSEVYVADALFATLGTSARTLVPATQPKILVTDTVGFIKKLPHDLVASFRATLEVAKEADLLLHVVDASDPAHPSQHEVTDQILAEIGAVQPRILVLNKMDRVTEPASLAEGPDTYRMSTRRPEDVRALHERIVTFFERDMVEGEIAVPYARQSFVAQIYRRCRVLGEAHDEVGTTLRVRADPQVLEELQSEVSAR